MQVAICDDEKYEANKIEFALLDVSKDIFIEYFQTGKALLKAVSGGKRFDCVYLDIYIKEENGMDIAYSLQQISPSTEIIFCTISMDHAVDAFKVKALDYIVKPYSEFDIVRAFSRVSAKKQQKSQKQILLKINNELQVFPSNDVIKIESDKHYSKLTMTDRTVKRIHMNFSDVIKNFGEDFVNIRRGISVCMDHIEKIKGNTIYLSDKSTCMMSMAKKNDILKIYVRYITENK